MMVNPCQPTPCPAQASRPERRPSVWRSALLAFLAMWLMLSTSVEAREMMIRLQEDTGLQRLVEHEVAHPGKSELAVHRQYLRLQRDPRPPKHVGPRNLPVAAILMATCRAPWRPRGPPHQPRAPPAC